MQLTKLSKHRNMLLNNFWVGGSHSWAGTHCPLHSTPAKQILHGRKGQNLNSFPLKLQIQMLTRNCAKTLTHGSIKKITICILKAEQDQGTPFVFYVQTWIKNSICVSIRNTFVRNNWRSKDLIRVSIDKRGSEVHPHFKLQIQNGD